MSGVLGETTQNTSTVGTWINYYRKQKKTNNKNARCVFPIHLYCLAVPRDRISPFLLVFFQAEIHICALYTSPTAGSADVHAARGSRACHGCVRAVPDFLGSPVSSTRPHQATQAPRSTLRTGPSVPAELLQSRRCQKLKCWWFFFFLSSPTQTQRMTEAMHPSPDSAKHRRYQDWLASSASEVHWHQRVYSWLKGVPVSQEISRCCTSPLCPLIRTLQSQVPMSTETTPKHPMFSLPDR